MYYIVTVYNIDGKGLNCRCDLRVTPLASPPCTRAVTVGRRRARARAGTGWPHDHHDARASDRCSVPHHPIPSSPHTVAPPSPCHLAPYLLPALRALSSGSVHYRPGAAAAPSDSDPGSLASRRHRRLQCCTRWRWCRAVKVLDDKKRKNT